MILTVAIVSSIFSCSQKTRSGYDVDTSSKCLLEEVGEIDIEYLNIADQAFNDLIYSERVDLLYEIIYVGFQDGRKNPSIKKLSINRDKYTLTKMRYNVRNDSLISKTEITRVEPFLNLLNNNKGYFYQTCESTWDHKVNHYYIIRRSGDVVFSFLSENSDNYKLLRESDDERILAFMNILNTFRVY